MLKKNQTAELEITDFTNEGMGVGHIDNMAVFVPGVTPGDFIEVLIVKVKSSYAYGKCIETKKHSAHSKTAECSAYKRCGGCQMMHMDYELQLSLKEKFIRDALTRIGGCSKDLQIDMIGSESDCGYRNKMVYPIGKTKDGETVCGFYAGRSHDIIPLSGCRLGLGDDSVIISAVLNFMKKHNISAYDEKSHSGLVRRLFIRRGKHSGETMVVLSVNGKKVRNSEELVSSLCEADSSVCSVILNVNEKQTNLVLGDKNIVLYGKEYITDTLCGNEYKISPHSFFQINPVQTERLYMKAIEYADICENDNVMDVYCGIGTISLTAAKHAKHVSGIEIVPQAIENAKQSARDNEVENASFYCGSAEEIVPKLMQAGENPDIVILDPPRKGSDEVTIKAVAEAKPKRIVYVSCNPATLARDVKLFREFGYEVSKATGVDMFPNTVHVETVVLLSQLKPDDIIEVDIDLDELDITSSESKATYEEIKAYVLDKYGFKVSSLYIAQIKTKYGIKDGVNYNISKKGSRVPACPLEKENAITEALKYFKMIE